MKTDIALTALITLILAWFVWAVFDTLKDRPTVDKGCEEMLCVS